MAKNYFPVSLISAVSKIFENRVGSRPIGHLEKCVIFSDLH